MRIATTVSVTLIIMGTLLLSVPAIFEMVMAGQESYAAAHNPAAELPRRELGNIVRFSFLLIGVAMISGGVIFARVRPSGSAEN